jgi:hypothetical protein
MPSEQINGIPKHGVSVCRFVPINISNKRLYRLSAEVGSSVNADDELLFYKNSQKRMSDCSSSGVDYLCFFRPSHLLSHQSVTQHKTQATSCQPFNLLNTLEAEILLL